MKNREIILNWLKRARSNLERAKLGKVSQGILYEDLCFDAQQAVEKSLKAILIKQNCLLFMQWMPAIPVIMNL